MSRAVNHLIYIRNAISEIRQWTIQGETEFKKNSVLIKATLYNLQTLAESTSLLPQAWKDEHPEVDWNGIKSFRNFLAHQFASPIAETPLTPETFPILAPSLKTEKFPQSREN